MATALTLVVPGRAPAAAPVHPRVVLGAPVVRATHVLLTGRAKPRSLVHLQALSGHRWRLLRTVRATSTGRFRATTRRPSGSQIVRASAAGAISPVRTVVLPSDACGVRPVKADGSYWQCTFTDGFAGTALDTRWWVPQQYAGNGGDLCYASSPQTIAVSGGALHLSAVRTGNGTDCPPRADGSRAGYATGSVTTWHTFGQQYGRFQARMRTPADNTPGLHAGFWLWPDTRTTSDADWPTTGEIDIAEIYSFRSDLVIPFLHYSADSLGPVTGLNTSYTGTITPGAWHTYTLTWTPDRLVIDVDGRTILTNSSGAASFRKAFILCLTQLLGTGANAFSPATPIPSSFDVDYVKVWK